MRQLYPCPTCKGTGANPMSDTVEWLPCMTCHGTRTVDAAMLAHLARISNPDADPFPRITSDTPATERPWLADDEEA